MAVTEYKLEVFRRDATNKGGLKKMRKEGKVPGIYYSHDSKDSIAFFINKSELHSIHKSGARLLKISVGGKLRTVFFKDVQYHPVTDEVLHLDLFGVNMDEKINIHISVLLEGEPIGVKTEGGKVTQPMTEIEVACLPGEIPETIVIDISEMHMGDSLHARDVELPENTSLVTPEEAVVASVTKGMREEEIEVEETDEEDISFEDTEAEPESE